MYDIARDLSDQCESPIEKQFMLAWIDVLQLNSIAGSKLIVDHPTIDEFLQIPEFIPYNYFTLSQFDGIWLQPTIAQYRVDFVLGRCAYGGEDRLTKLPLLVIECDGHDFHERTKEQAAKDKSRDRFLTSQNFRVLRFTGSEIYKDPRRCAEEVDATFAALLYPRACNAMG